MPAALLARGAPPQPADEAQVQDLVRRARTGDRGAAQALYRLHVGRVWRAVRPLVGDDAEAEDVVQDTFIRALGALGRYRRREGIRFVAWLLTIAVREARRGRRRRRETPTAAEALQARREAPTAPGAGDPEGEAMRDERARLLLAGLAELPERDRRVVALRYGAGLEAREVARAAGLSEANVRKICERTRRRLAERLAPLLGGTP